VFDKKSISMMTKTGKWEVVDSFVSFYIKSISTLTLGGKNK